MHVLLYIASLLCSLLKIVNLLTPWSPCWVIARWSRYHSGCGIFLLDLFGAPVNLEVSGSRLDAITVRRRVEPGVAWRTAADDLITEWTFINCHVFFFSAIYCMSQKVEKPVLSGQRIKTRKRGNLLFVTYFHLYVGHLPRFHVYEAG